VDACTVPPISRYKMDKLGDRPYTLNAPSGSCGLVALACPPPSTEATCAMAATC
jgi:hypothetical protein